MLKEGSNSKRWWYEMGKTCRRDSGTMERMLEIGQRKSRNAPALGPYERHVGRYERLGLSVPRVNQLVKRDKFFLDWLRRCVTRK